MLVKLEIDDIFNETHANTLISFNTCKSPNKRISLMLNQLLVADKNKYHINSDVKFLIHIKDAF